jgi:flagellar motility protein MotE (MotC chaperone)
MGKLKEILRKNARIRITLPFFAYEITPDELLSGKSVDERISQLEKVRSDLMDAVGAVESLQEEAQKSKEEVTNLNQQLAKLREDKETTESLLRVPEESFARVLDKASSKAQWKGLIIGFFLGILASLAANAIWQYAGSKTNTHNNQLNQDAPKSGAPVS